MAELPLTGGCLCGGVRFEVTAPLVSAAYCHCRRCQRRTGSAASASGRVAPGSLRIVAGQELVRSYQPPDGFAKDFCPGCGSALWSRSRTTGCRATRSGGPASSGLSYWLFIGST